MSAVTNCRKVRFYILSCNIGIQICRPDEPDLCSLKPAIFNRVVVNVTGKSFISSESFILYSAGIKTPCEICFLHHIIVLFSHT